jgi:hypothetical protein
MKLLWSISTTKKFVQDGCHRYWKAQDIMDSAFTFLECYHQEAIIFGGQIVTGDETWVSHIIPESKHQSLEWQHSHLSSNPHKIQMASTLKVLAIVFWDQKGFLLAEFMPKGPTINAASLCNSEAALMCHPKPPVRPAVNRGVVLLHDNACPHTAAGIRALLADFAWAFFFSPSSLALWSGHGSK